MELRTSGTEGTRHTEYLAGSSQESGHRCKQCKQNTAVDLIPAMERQVSMDK